MNRKGHMPPVALLLRFRWDMRDVAQDRFIRLYSAQACAYNE